MRLNWIDVLLLAPILSLECDEALPPRRDPTDLFSAQLQTSYVFKSNQNGVLINLIANNNFDETLSGRTGIKGTIATTSIRDTSVHKTIPLGTTNLIHGKYDAFKGILTIDPGDSLILQVTWDFTDDNGDSLSAYFFQYRSDSSCPKRLISNPEYFNVAGKTKLFAQLGYAESNMSFQIRQYYQFVDPRDCAAPPQAK